MSEYQDYEDDHEIDPYEAALEECGQVPDGTCMLTGTEHCDFECPFRDDLYKTDNQPPGDTDNG